MNKIDKLEKGLEKTREKADERQAKLGAVEKTNQKKETSQIVNAGR